ncbi:MAG: High-affinity branched-chain amino acid transport ATP-binding protein LivF [Chloroflexi bacterium]|nr:High-affinity branched-chain amino acid transport ATP-binding protein LivF [Chloroflexota bacterium]
MLEIKDLYVGYYSDLNIIQGVDLIAREQQITAILGANGVGKSTLLKSIYGFLKPNSGEIWMGDRRVDGTPTHELINLGISYIPQHTGLFKWMSVEENIELGGWTFRKDKDRLKQKLEESYERFPVLKEKRKQAAGELSGGQQRMVEISRTLMTDPKVILVDEPTAGLAKLLSQDVYDMLTDLRDNDGLTIVLVDQEIRSALKVSDYVYVLDLGHNHFDGPVDENIDLEEVFWA